MNTKSTLSSQLFKTLAELLSIPTTSFHERWLSSEVSRQLSALSRVTIAEDKAGNLFVSYRPRKTVKSKLCLQVHMDHPGYVALQSRGSRNFEAEALGGVPCNSKGGTLRFFSTPIQRGISAEITKELFTKEGRTFVEFKSKSPVPAGAVGMWDFPPLKKKGNWIEGWAFDDNLNVALLVHIVQRASKEKWPEPFDALFTRAEEVGYLGTYELLKKRSFKLPDTIITLEAPRARGEVRAGDGVILRVGDKHLTFDPWTLLQLDTIAAELGAKVPSFKAQRRLGWAGGIESTLYQLAGYQTASLSIAIENAHNTDLNNHGRPAPERAHLTDLFSMILMLERLLQRPISARDARKKLKKKLAGQIEPWLKTLRASARELK